MRLFLYFLIFLITVIHTECNANDLVGVQPKNSYYKVEKREHEQTLRVTLTNKAIENLHITTLKLPSSYNHQEGTRVPSSSVLYDVYGTNWVYAQDTPISYYRVKVNLRKVEKNFSFITIVDEKSPPSTIVNNGVSALYGIESGVGK